MGRIVLYLPLSQPTWSREMFTLYCLVDDKSSDPVRFKAEHGLSIAIETHAGQILFDTGQSGDVLIHNAAQLGVDLAKTDALVFSHAHYDHTGGLEALLKISQPGLPIYAHPDLFRERFAIKNGKIQSIGIRMSEDDLAKVTSLKLSVEPFQILPGIWTTGEITTRTEFQGRSSQHHIRGDVGWQPDPYLDDMSLVLEAKSGLIVVCGCCHAGLLNTLIHVRSKFNHEIAAIIGGAHLAQVNEECLEKVIAFLRLTSTREIPFLYLNHCTGDHALDILSKAFEKKVQSCPAGFVLMLE
jgi:7,8-dihydropterin-6-yl-methyl-4-(beta-D-ribofuranosyl)aminobenzene 5'-phosphate synthase